LGLTAVQKLILQFLAAGLYLAVLGIAGFGTTTTIPFVGQVDLGIFYYIIAAIAIVGIVNSVNLTDGVDGLNGSVTFFACVAFMMIASLLSYLGVTAMCAASAGACLGFLVWNFHPAKVFMGDTGSLFLGGLVCGLAFALDMPILLIPVGIIYIAEELSVILQVSYFKLTHGKRLFKMSPIHHHFEMCGWSEVKIVAVFSAVTALFGAVAFALAYFGV
jgi:phospho-N-acetylmuramoyl-pentapeptide-transferase